MIAETLERRFAPRKQAHFSVLCRSGIQNFAGKLVNISESGALLESEGNCPAVGSIVTIEFNSPELDKHIKLKGKVVRHTGSGFAIEFLGVTKELLELVGDL